VQQVVEVARQVLGPLATPRVDLECKGELCSAAAATARGKDQASCSRATMLVDVLGLSGNGPTATLSAVMACKHAL